MSESNPNRVNIVYSQDDDAVFDQAVLKMRQELAKGKTFAQACEVLHDIDAKLRPLIKDDFLKIVIAEQHFGQGRGIEDVALFLDLPYEIVDASRTRIMKEFDEVLANPFDNEVSQSTH